MWKTFIHFIKDTAIILNLVCAGINVTDRAIAFFCEEPAQIESSVEAPGGDQSQEDSVIDAEYEEEETRHV